MSGAFLEPFLESIQILPCNLKRNLTLLRELDSKVAGFISSIEQECKEYNDEVSDLQPSEKCRRVDKVLSMYDLAYNLSEDKKQLALQTYNLVDKQIQQLDVELSKFDAELDDKSLIAKDTTQVKRKSSKPSKEKVLSKTSAEPSKVARKKIPEVEAPVDVTRTIIATKPELALNMEIDPNEPLYCICNQVSFGEMVGCDEADCKYEWFHFACVGLKAKPKGKWYCPECALKKKGKQTLPPQ